MTTADIAAFGPTPQSPRCVTCRSPYKTEAELRFVEVGSYVQVVRELPPDSGLSPRRFREHLLRGHLGVESAVVQRLVRAMGDAHAAVLEAGVMATVARLAEASTVIQEVTRKINTGEMKPTVGQAIRLARLIETYDAAVRRDRRLEGLLQESHGATAAILALVKSLIPPETWSALLRAMEDDSVMRVHVPVPSSA